MGSDDAKKGKKRSSKNSGSESGKGKADDRFASALSDPRFMEAPLRKAKVAIDSRFQRVFTDSKFASSNAPVDKRGKPAVEKNKKASASLKHYYRLQEEEEEEEDKNAGSDGTDSDSDESEEQSSDESASTSSTDSDEELMDDGEEDTFMPPEENIPEIEKETHRLAIVNLDWNQVRAVDLYVLLSSFLPKDGQIVSVTVYPSEFGLQRMEEEATRGPVGLFDDTEEYDMDDDDNEIDDKKLRAYELSRLRYYYAVVDCDSISTADFLYRTCDGLEFERSANKLDLRFIPDSMNFKQSPRDVATETPSNYEGVDFQTRALQQSNVHLTWDEDEPQRARTLNRKLNADQLAELELKEFLASDESEADEVDDDIGDTQEKSMRKRNKQDMYRALIQSGDGSDDHHDEDGDQDMEVTFNSGLEDISKRILEKKNKESETVWDSYLRKRREKKKALKNRSKYSSEDDDSDTDQEPTEQVDDFFVEDPSLVENKGNQVRRAKRENLVQATAQEEAASKAELELLLADDKGADKNLKGYNMKPRKKDGKKRKEVPDESKIPTLDSDDPRFAALFTSHHFALDPTNPQFKRSATYTRQIAQKRKINRENDQNEHSVSGQTPECPPTLEDKMAKSDAFPERKEKYKLASMVKSIKMKSKQLPLPGHDNLPRKNKGSRHRSKEQ